MPEATFEAATTPADGTTSTSQAALDQLVAQATQQYSLKNYGAAVEFYSEAAEVQDQINGEMSPANADLLYQYGRCLYHVAVSKSDVLGGKVAGEEPKRKKRKVTKAESSNTAVASGEGVVDDALEDGEQKTAEEVVEQLAGKASGVTEPSEKSKIETDNKPFFQITGDENWTDSEGSDAEDEGDPEEEEDDFAIAYEILDVARVLLSRKLANAQEFTHSKSRTAQETTDIKQTRERLADTHDLQAEISLENERFRDAINDTRDALALKLQLYPEESSLIAEAHFKLSLALEFASVTASNTEDGDEQGGQAREAQVDEDMRMEAAAEMEKAIASCRLRVYREEAALESLSDADLDSKRRSIADVSEMIQDMNNRLVDLRNPAVSLSGPTGPAGAPDGSDPLRGVLGAMLGESRQEQQKRIQEATAGANDLSGLVKKKKVKSEGTAVLPAEAVVFEGNGKRKAEEQAATTNGHEKKTKLEEGC